MARRPRYTHRRNKLTREGRNNALWLAGVLLFAIVANVLGAIVMANC